MRLGFKQLETIGKSEETEKNTPVDDSGKTKKSLNKKAIIAMASAMAFYGQAEAGNKAAPEKDKNIDLSEIPNVGEARAETERTANFEDYVDLGYGQDTTLKDIEGLDSIKKILKSAEENPGNFLSHVRYFKDIKGLDLAGEITKAASKNFMLFLCNAKDFKDIKGLDLAGEIMKAANEDAWAFIIYAKDFKDIKGLDLAGEIMKAASWINSGIFLSHAQDFKDIKGLDLAGELMKAAGENPGAFLGAAKDFKDIEGLDLAGEISKAAGEKPASFLFDARYFKDIKDLDLTREISKAASEAPGAFLSTAKDFKDIEGLDLVGEITRAASRYPEAFINNIANLQDIVEGADSQVIKKLKEIKDENSAVLLHKMVNDSLTEEEALKIIGDSEQLFKNLIEIKSIPGHLGETTVEMKLEYICLEKVSEINRLHESPDDVRFKSLKNLTAQEVYSLMVYAEEEIYTSSFNGCFKRLLEKIDKEKIDGRVLLDQVGNNKFRTFIKECTGFNKLDKFLDKMSKDDAHNLLRDAVRGIESSDNKLDQALSLADIFGNIDNPETLKVIQEQVKEEFERINNNPEAKESDKVMYGLLAGLFGNSAVIEPGWFKQMSQDYKMERVSGLESKDLFDKDGICIQKYHFFQNGNSDKDGVNSFASFKNKYKNDPNWKIDESHRNFVVITGKKSGRTVEIYANNPEVGDYGRKGLEEMDKLLKDKEIKLYSYRGHSFGLSLDGISSATRITNLGSCGGYNNINKILSLSPETHVISTKGTGTTDINDPIFKDLNDKILNGENIDWGKFWSEEERKLGASKYFRDYIAPHKNQGMMYMKAYKKLME